jgi:hypothetical protein
MKNIYFIFVLLLFFSCGSSINYDYDLEADFSAYKTYAFNSEMNSGLSDLDQKRILRAIENKLELLGLTKSDSPDLLVDLKSKVYSNLPNPGIWGIQEGEVAEGVTINNVRTGNPNNRWMLIELVDMSKSNTVWMAISDKRETFGPSPVDRDAYYNDLIEKVFEKYPPSRN